MRIKRMLSWEEFKVYYKINLSECTYYFADPDLNKNYVKAYNTLKSLSKSKVNDRDLYLNEVKSIFESANSQTNLYSNGCRDIEAFNQLIMKYVIDYYLNNTTYEKIYNKFKKKEKHIKEEKIEKIDYLHQKTMFFKPMLRWEDFKQKYDIHVAGWHWFSGKTEGPYKNVTNDEFLKEWYEDTYKRLHKYFINIKSENPDSIKWFYEIAEEEVPKYIQDSYWESTSNLTYLHRCMLDYYIKDLSFDYREECKKSDAAFMKIYRYHRRYKRRYYFGIIAWMSICFWLPFFIGFLQGYDVAMMYCEGFERFLSMCATGFAYVCLAAFTFPVTMPLSFIMGLVVHPKMLKFIMFEANSNGIKYDESMMNVIGHSTERENVNKAAVMAGTAIRKFLK